MTLSIVGITKRYGGLVAVNGVSFDAAPGQITSVIGPNGAGKTTLLNLMSGTVKPDSGSVHLQGVDLTYLESYVRARNGMARTYQNPQLFDDMTVLETVQVGAHQTGNSSFFSAMLRTPTNSDACHTSVPSCRLMACKRWSLAEWFIIRTDGSKID